MSKLNKLHATAAEAATLPLAPVSVISKMVHQKSSKEANGEKGGSTKTLQRETFINEMNTEATVGAKSSDNSEIDNSESVSGYRTEVNIIITAG